MSSLRTGAIAAVDFVKQPNLTNVTSTDKETAACQMLSFHLLNVCALLEDPSLLNPVKRNKMQNTSDKNCLAKDSSAKSHRISRKQNSLASHVRKSCQEKIQSFQTKMVKFNSSEAVMKPKKIKKDYRTGLTLPIRRLTTTKNNLSKNSNKKWILPSSAAALLNGNLPIILPKRSPLEVTSDGYSINLGSIFAENDSPSTTAAALKYNNLLLEKESLESRLGTLKHNTKFSEKDPQPTPAALRHDKIFTEKRPLPTTPDVLRNDKMFKEKHPLPATPDALRHDKKFTEKQPLPTTPTALRHDKIFTEKHPLPTTPAALRNDYVYKEKDLLPTDPAIRTYDYAFSDIGPLTKTPTALRCDNLFSENGSLAMSEGAIKSEPIFLENDGLVMASDTLMCETIVPDKDPLEMTSDTLKNGRIYPEKSHLIMSYEDVNRDAGTVKNKEEEDMDIYEGSYDYEVLSEDEEKPFRLVDVPDSSDDDSVVMIKMDKKPFTVINVSDSSDDDDDDDDEEEIMEEEYDNTQICEELFMNVDASSDDGSPKEDPLAPSSDVLLEKDPLALDSDYVKDVPERDPLTTSVDEVRVKVEPESDPITESLDGNSDEAITEGATLTTSVGEINDEAVPEGDTLTMSLGEINVEEHSAAVDSHTPTESRQLLIHIKMCCIYCGYSTVSRLDLKGHMKYIHKINSRFKNDLSTIIRKRSKYEHEKILGEISCFHCPFMSSRATTLRKHIIAKHMSEKSYTCMYCKFNTRFTHKLLEHMLSSHSKKTPKIIHTWLKENPRDYKKHCSPLKNTSSLYSNKQHPSKPEKDERNSLVYCPHCPFSSNVAQEIVSHLNTEHTKKNPQQKESGGFTQPSFSSKSHQLMARLNTEQNNNAKYSSLTFDLSDRNEFNHQIKTSNAFKCTICRFNGGALFQLEQHLITSHTAEDDPLVCAICEFKATDANEIIKHFKVCHNKQAISYVPVDDQNESGNEKSLKLKECLYCFYNCRDSRDYVFHLAERHVNMFPMKCNYCNFEAGRPEELAEHIRLKRSERKPYACHLCHYSTPEFTKLRNHIYAKHKNTYFSCYYCSNFLDTAKKLRYHILVSHEEVMIHETTQTKNISENKVTCADSHDKGIQKITRDENISNVKNTCENEPEAMESDGGRRSSHESDSECNIHACSDCSFVALSIEELFDHVSKNHVESSLRSANSSENHSIPEYSSHVDNSLDAKRLFNCIFCDYSIDSFKQLKTHLMTDHKNKKYSLCKECCIVVKRSDDLKIVAQKHVLFECPTCEFRTIDFDELKDHAESKHKTRFIISCIRCGYYKATDRDEWVEHLKSAHGETNMCSLSLFRVVGIDEQKVSCCHCSYTSPSFMDLFDHSKQLHRGLSIVSCIFCDYISSQPIAIEKHINARHYTRTRFCCHICSHTHWSKNMFLRHMAFAHGVKFLLNCSHCEFTCCSSISLSIHFDTTHSSAEKSPIVINPWETISLACPLCESYVSRNDMINHIISVHSAVKWFCTYCEYTAGVKEELEFHVNVLHQKGINFSSCPYCPLASHLTKINKHIEEEHRNCDQLSSYKNKTTESEGTNSDYIQSSNNKNIFEDEGTKGTISVDKQLNIEKTKIIIKNKDDDLPCTKCNEIFDSIESLKQHMVSIHKVVFFFGCPRHGCSFKAATNTRLREHMKSHQISYANSTEMHQGTASHPSQSNKGNPLKRTIQLLNLNAEKVQSYILTKNNKEVSSS